MKPMHMIALVVLLASYGVIEFVLGYKAGLKAGLKKAKGGKP